MNTVAIDPPQRRRYDTHVITAGSKRSGEDAHGPRYGISAGRRHARLRWETDED